jgi:hypothetical protein
VTLRQIRFVDSVMLRNSAMHTECYRIAFTWQAGDANWSFVTYDLDFGNVDDAWLHEWLYSTSIRNERHD